MRERALRLLMERVTELEADRVRALRTGTPETFEQYREQVGYLQALDAIRTECGEIEKRLHAPEEHP